MLTEDQMWAQFDAQVARDQWVPVQVAWLAFDSTVAPVEVTWRFVRKDELTKRGVVARP